MTSLFHMPFVGAFKEGEKSFAAMHVHNNSTNSVLLLKQYYFKRGKASKS